MKNHNELFGQPNTLYLYVFIHLTHTHPHILYTETQQKNEGGKLMSFMKISTFINMTGQKIMTISSISGVGR